MNLTNEDLLAFSHLLDVKLNADIQTIKNEIQSVKAELQTEIQSVKAELQTEIQSVKAELQAEIHQINLFLENVVMPRLNTIEGCYTSTYIRYKDSVEGYEAMQADNEIIKSVLAEHSEKLQKLA